MALISPFLDKDFQQVARLTPGQVDLFARLALLAHGKVVATPSPFVESNSSRSSILLHEDIQLCGHLELSYREVNLEAFGNKKLREYANIREYASVYSEQNLETVLQRFTAPRRARGTRIGTQMRETWLAEVDDEDEPLNLRHAISFASNSTLDAFREVPNITRGKAFVWQEVFRVLDGMAPKWRSEVSVEVVKAILARHYFRALTQEGDTLVSFTDFPAFPADQGLAHRDTLMLMPLLRLFYGCGLLEWVRSCPPAVLIEVLNSPHITDFRLAYDSVVQAASSGGPDEVLLRLQGEYLRELSYYEARESLRAKHTSEMLIFRILGSRIPALRRRRTPVATFIEGLRSLEQSLSGPSLTEAQTVVNNYYVMNAGAVGPGARARNFTQTSGREI